MAETRALLIGVSGYDSQSGIPSLRGPRNDVRLMRDVLTRRSVSDIRVLADGVEGSSGQPDRGTIAEALTRLADDAVAGDLVIISMSGHGTQQPDRDGDEADGLDEVFLPADATGAEPGSGAIPNALTDDELGEMVSAIRRKGADVFFVLDSCHSGSGLRAPSISVADRYVDPAVLGIRSAVAEGSTISEISMIDGADADEQGGLVAFYAARSSEVAREVDLTPGSGDDDGWYGLFTSRLAARLESAGPVSYRQLYQAVLSDLNSSAGLGAVVQTPSWEGDLIDATVLGGRDALGLRQFPVSGDELSAGLVHGFGPGTLFRLVADAADPAGAGLGLAQIEEAEPTRAYLRPVDENCTPQAEALCDRVGSLPSDAKFARLIAQPADVVLRLAPPVSVTDGAFIPASDPLFAALESAIATVNASGGAEVVFDRQLATIAVGASDGRLWFGRRILVGDTPVGLSWAPQDATELTTLLIRIAEAERLAGLLGAASDGQSPLNPSPISLTAELTSALVSDLDAPGAGTDPERECRRALGAAGAPVPLDIGDALELKQCDMLSIAARGETPGLRDVNMIHIDSRFCLRARHRRIDDFRVPMTLGAPMVICSDCPDGYAAGDERLFIVVTEAENNSDQLNLEGLLENCGADGAPTRGIRTQAAIEFLTSAARRPDTRGSFGGMLLSHVWVSEYRWQVLPREEVFARQAGGDLGQGMP